MTLRQANEQDVLDIVSLEKECFGDAWSEKQIEGILSNSLYDVYVLSFPCRYFLLYAQKVRYTFSALNQDG